MCDDGFVFVNGKTAKASYVVKKNDKISIYFKQKKVEYLVVDIPEGTVKSSEACGFYEILGEEVYEENQNRHNHG